MLAIALSLLFGLIAFGALVEIHASLAKGLRRGREIGAELRGTGAPCEVLSREAAFLPAPAAELWLAAA